MTISQDDLDYLVDRNEIAHLLDVGPTAVSNYVARTSDKHPAFPEPVIVRGLGRFRLWDLDDVVDWYRSAFPSRTDLDGPALTLLDRLAEFRDGQ